MNPNYENTIAAIAVRIFKYVADDLELKNLIRQLAQDFIDHTDIRPADESPAVAVDNQITTPDEPPVREPLPELTLGRQSFAPEPVIQIADQGVEIDLSAIEARCRLKAESARWAATRKRLLADGASFNSDIGPQDRTIIAQAKALTNCFLWMLHPTGPTPANLAIYERVAHCFDAVAETTSLIRTNQSDVERSDFEEMVNLLAEAQSALKVAVREIEGPIDTDQDEAFRWLRQIAVEHKIYIPQYMKLEQAADPNRASAIIARTKEVSARVEVAKRRQGQQKKLLGKVKYKAKKIQDAPDREAGEWHTLIGTVCELVGGGLPPSHRELRDLLLPVIELLPESETIPWDFERVLVEIDRYLASVPSQSFQKSSSPSKEVTEAETLLRGKSLVLIGGDQRPGASQAIKESFGLKELIWIETRAHESFESFGPYVARPDVVAVLLAIRWSSHSYGEVKNFCEMYHKPLVRLPGGYNPNQVAAQILAQASDRLKSP